MFTGSLSGARNRSPTPTRLSSRSWKAQGWTSGTAGPKRTLATCSCFHGSSLDWAGRVLGPQRHRPHLERAGSSLQ